jgi:Fur family ferric uptake transcriptional regulator
VNQNHLDEKIDKRNLVIDMLKDVGYRITKQRIILIDIILDGQCTCCKEIYYQAVKKDSKIGTATVYRMVNTLEEIGVISREINVKID